MLFRSDGAGRDLLAGVLPWAIFSGLPLLGCLVVIAVALRSMQAARARPTGAFVAAFLAVGMVFTGLIGSAVQRIDVLDLAGTAFEEGALVYVAYGAVLASMAMRALLAGDDAAPRTLRLAGLGVLAIVLAALPMYALGLLDQPAGSLGGFDDGGAVGALNLVSGAGHALFVLYLLGVGAAWGGRMGRKAGA